VAHDGWFCDRFIPHRFYCVYAPVAKGGGQAMSSEKIVEVTDIKMAYRRTRHRVSSLKQTAIETIKRRMEYEQFFALNGVSFDIARGETVSIIGRNGAGKSTLLKVVARVLPPTSGRVIVRGHVAPMIELGAGFNGELTGAENIMLYGTLLGRSVQQMKSRIEAIGDWAGLSAHLDVPIRAYSSGMVARLAFATATDETSDLLLIDEILSVGDEDFREKSAARIVEMMNSGCAVLLVSHDLGAVKSMSTRAIYLENGTPKVFGSPDEVVQSYIADVKH
jgi:ABC-type polysaccharide/polyol phosphate transport system ATPase subunit